MTMGIFRHGQPERHGASRANGRGFSLVEAITVIGIMTIVLVMVTQIFSVTYDVFVKQTARTENETGAVLAARTVADLTRGASAVMTSQVINGTTYTTGADTLVLKLPAIDSSNNVLAATYDYVAIYRDGTLTTKIFSDTDAAASSRRVDGKKLVTAYNQTMRFRYNDPDVSKATRVQAYLVNQQTTRSTTLTTKGWTAIFLRNND
jgi:type II secretory pathway pseudopilin PulG